MTVNQFDPNQTTTLETPKKVLGEQSNTPLAQGDIAAADQAPRVGFISLG